MGSKGTRTLVKVCQLVAVSERHSRTASAFVLARPVVVATAIGKNAINTENARREGLPTPSQTTNSGATATFGINWKQTMLG